MASRLIDFSQPPVSYPADMQWTYWWNGKQHEPVVYERPLTREQLAQGQAILFDIEKLPRFLKSRLFKYIEHLRKEKTPKEVHNWLVFKFHKSIYQRLLSVNARYGLTKDKRQFLLDRDFDQAMFFNRLPDAHDKILRHMAKTFADASDNLFAELADQAIAENNGDREVLLNLKVINPIYQQLGQLITYLHVTPLFWGKAQKGKLTPENALSGLNRLTNEDWWLKKLKAHRQRWRESLHIAFGDVNSDKTPYASKNAVREVRAQRLANMNYLEMMDIQDVESGDRFDLMEKVLASIANPKIRRMELMAQAAGIQKVAEERGDIGLFITLTTPSKYHPTKQINVSKDEKKKKVLINEKWNNSAYTPKDGQRYLVKVWAKIRTAFKDNDINVYGIRVVEPHHDATPHWHMMMFLDKSQRASAIEIMRKYALEEDGEERGAKKHRFEAKHLNKGGATGYLAKYISKNIDGYALEGEVDDESGELLTEVASAVTAWASTWRIPQFHMFGLPSKGVWRECRRVRGVSIADKLGDIAEKVRASADAGDFAAYIEHQGGPNVKRHLQTLLVARTVADEPNSYDEEVMRVIGLCSPLKSGDLVKTRERQYRLVRKSKQDIEAIEHKRKLETGRVLTLKSAISAPRSPVNNCGSGSSPDIKNPHDRGLKSPVWGISEPEYFDLHAQYSDWEKSFGEVLEHKKNQRIISTVSLSENQERLIPEFKAFAEKMGLDLPPDTMWSMVMNGMRLSYGDEVIWLENGKIQISSTKSEKVNFEEVKQKNISNTRDRVMAKVNKLRGKND